MLAAMWGAIAIACVAGAVFLFLCLIFIVSLVEKRRIDEFEPMTDSNFVEASAYLADASFKTAALGFTHVGELRHKIYRLRASIWISPDRRTIARTVGGTMIKIPVKRAMFISRLNNGRILSTTDEIGLSDPTEFYWRKLVLNAHPDELWKSHQEILASAGDLVETIDSELAELLQWIEYEDVRRRVAFGYARMLDPATYTYRCTVKGAFWNATIGNFRAARTSGVQQSRVSLPRPGT